MGPESCPNSALGEADDRSGSRCGREKRGLFRQERNRWEPDDPLGRFGVGCVLECCLEHRKDMRDLPVLRNANERPEKEPEERDVDAAPGRHGDVTTVADG